MTPIAPTTIMKIRLCWCIFKAAMALPVHSDDPDPAASVRLSMPEAADGGANFALIALNDNGQKVYRTGTDQLNHGCADATCAGCGDDLWASDEGWIGLPPGYGFLCRFCKHRRGEFPEGAAWMSREDYTEEELAPPHVRLSMPEATTAVHLPSAPRFSFADDMEEDAADAERDIRFLPASAIVGDLWRRAWRAIFWGGATLVGVFLGAVAAAVIAIFAFAMIGWVIYGNSPLDFLSSAFLAAAPVLSVKAAAPRFSYPPVPPKAAWLDGYKWSSKIDGTCRRGCLRGIDESELVRIFGASHYAGSEPMWAFANAAGEVFTIADYKGERWSIGGRHKSKIAVDMVHGILRAAGVDCQRRDMLLYDKPFEPVLYVGDLPELPCEAYSWAPERGRDSALVSVLKAVRAIMVSGWNPTSRGFAINSRGIGCHSAG